MLTFPLNRRTNHKLKSPCGWKLLETTSLAATIKHKNTITSLLSLSGSFILSPILSFYVQKT